MLHVGDLVLRVGGKEETLVLLFGCCCLLFNDTRVSISILCGFSLLVIGARGSTEVSNFRR